MAANSFDTSFNLTEKEPTIGVPVYKYLDIDSTYRNRNNYPNPNNFVIPITYPGRNSTAATAIDPIVDAIPFTASSNPPGSNVTQAGSTTNSIVLGTGETTIDNFYVNTVLEIAGQFRTISSYVGSTHIAIVTVAFPGAPVAGTVYYTRKIQPFFVGTVAAVPAPTPSSFALAGGPSIINNIYSNSYVRFTSGVNSGLVFLISSYVGLTNVVTLSSTMPNVPGAGDTLELDSFSRDNASTLVYSGTVNNSSQNAYYEIELCWLSVPNLILGVGYGGALDRYPYIYVSLYNEGRRLYNQPMFSNNPNSTLALFKVPVNEYFGDTSFLTLKDAKSKQVVRFETNQDIRFTITLPDGTIVEYAEPDSLSPLEPNPFNQVNALFAFRKIT
ncbi:MAG: hypothetical protein PHG66_04965 [Candidatus Colwellbacteria bacterium]|nr:hypothetical protein [Candidatus Colwellbacteria bacterium]